MKWFLMPVVISVFIVGGCSRSSKAVEVKQLEEETASLELVVYANEGMLRNYENTVNAFNSTRSDISVDIHNVYGEDWSDFDRTLRSYIHSGRIPDIVDISVIYRDNLIRQGMLKDLMPFARDAGMDFDLYFEGQFEGLMTGDALYGIPSGALLMAVYINKDLFGAAGIPLPDTDWKQAWSREEFADAARKISMLSAPGNPVYGMTQSYDIGWLIPHFLASGSGFLTDAEAACGGRDPEIENTLAFLGDLMFKDMVSPSIAELANLQPYQYFMNGNLGIFVDGNWWMEGFRESADFDWGVVPMPIDDTLATGMYVDCWAVPEESSQGREAFEVLQFFLEEDQQRSGIMKGIPAMKSVARDIYSTRFTNLSEEEIDVWFDGIQYGKVPAYFENWSNFQNETTNILYSHGRGDIDSRRAAELICASYNQER